MITIGFTIVIALILTFSIWVIRGQQATIDRLTDKLMARDYGDYKKNHGPTPAIEEKPARKPLSWHDDPSIEQEEIN